MSDQKLSLSDFDYHLPESLIAQKPAEPRDHSRLLVYNRSDRTITDDYFYRLPDYLPENSALVINNSRVEKSRLLFKKKEVFVTRVIDPYTVEAMIRPGKAFKAGRTVELAERTSGFISSDESSTDFTSGDNRLSEPIRAKVLHIADDGLRTLRFNYPVSDPVFDSYRRTPFPPYIQPDETLSDRYQTVYARDDGSKAAPTAGLHFTDRIFEALSHKSIDKVELTLHVGLGTFAPVKTENISEHKIHSEWFQIPEEAAKKLRYARHITAVGTTSARVLESAVQVSAVDPGPGRDGIGNAENVLFRNFSACEGNTDIFITPGYRFRAVDSLITNFHLPRSTLLMMISAFIGTDEMHRIYRHAIKEKYRFYSFGDAMLLL